MGAARAWTTVSGKNAAGKAVKLQGQEATREVWFDPDIFVVGLNEDVSPPRVEVTLKESIKALLLSLNSASGYLVLESLEVRTIIAKGTGNPPSANIADLEIVTKTQAVGVYDQLFAVVGQNSLDMTPEPKLAFFGRTSVGIQVLPGGWTTADLQDALENYGLVVE